MLAETPLTVLMVISSNKHTVVMHYMSLIKGKCVPVDNLTSHPEANFGKINKVVIAGFKGLRLNKLHALDFSA